jgi:hypothetical protein
MIAASERGDNQPFGTADLTCTQHDNGINDN